MFFLLRPEKICVFSQFEQTFAKTDFLKTTFMHNLWDPKSTVLEFFAENFPTCG